MELSYKKYRKKLGIAIREKRVADGLSQEALAAKIDGVCSKTVQRIETASYPRDMKLHVIQAICEELKFPVKLNLGE